MHQNATRTHQITHSAVFARLYAGHQASADWSEAKLRSELLHGVAAQEVFVALFDGFDDFDAMANEAVQAPVPRPASRQRRSKGERAPVNGARAGRESGASTERSAPAGTLASSYFRS